MEQNEKKQSVKSRFSVFMAGALLALAGMLVSGSSWFVQFSQPAAPYIQQASEYAQKASEVSRVAVKEISKSYGSATSGLHTNIASSSTLTVGTSTPNLRLLFPNSPGCAARVVGTVGEPVMLYFGSSQVGSAGDATTTVSAFVGYVQAASTTVVYDGGLYGCGYVGVIPFAATTTITRSEFR